MWGNLHRWIRDAITEVLRQKLSMDWPCASIRKLPLAEMFWQRQASVIYLGVAQIGRAQLSGSWGCVFESRSLDNILLDVDVLFSYIVV